MELKFKGMKAADFNPDLQRFPALASPKIDGYRTHILKGRAAGYSQKEFPNPFVQSVFGSEMLNGLDGEITVGPANAPNVIQRTAEIMRKGAHVPDVHFHVFDDFSQPDVWRLDAKSRQDRVLFRLRHLADQFGGTDFMSRIHYVAQTVITSMDELEEYETRALSAGYEGVMLKNPNLPYKFGRSTAREGGLIKVKRFEDKEAIIDGFGPAMHNTNEAVRNALGRTERSSAQAGLVPLDMVGRIYVHDFDGPNGARRDYEIGPGKMDHGVRKAVWATQNMFIGKPVKFKYFPHGEKDVPRHGSFLEFRHPITM